jgi:hypothetical protein
MEAHQTRHLTHTLLVQIAAYWRASLAAMGADRVRDMVDMLTATSATLVAEVLSPETQHIVDYSQYVT